MFIYVSIVSKPVVSIRVHTRTYWISKQKIVSRAIVQWKVALPSECFLFNATDAFDVEQYLLVDHNETINYCRRVENESAWIGVLFSDSSLNVLTLEFVIHAIQLKNQRPFSLPDCYHFLVKVVLHQYFG